MTQPKRRSNQWLVNSVAVGDRVRAARLKRELALSGAADRVGFSPEMLDLLEQGKLVFRLEKLVEIARHGTSI